VTVLVLICAKSLTVGLCYTDCVACDAPLYKSTTKLYVPLFFFLVKHPPPTLTLAENGIPIRYFDAQ
jgi:hypothetical protein